MDKRVALFALGLGAGFALAFAVGSAVEPADTEAGPGHGEHQETIPTAEFSLAVAR